MPLSAVTSAALTYYAANGAALFPIPAGQKNPTGIVESFKHDFSTDPAQWARWSDANPGCNWGVVAFASNWIIVDADTSGAEGREAAWQEWCGLCASWGVAPLMPHVQSARGGWHFYFKVPDGVDAAQLRQPDAVKDRINIRCIGYTVAAGSYYDGTPKGELSGHYLLLSDAAPPHTAPAALVQHCTRAPRVVSPTPPGSRDLGDIRALITWLAERGAFEAYEDWVGVGMSLKLELGDAGIDVWAIAHDATVDPDTIETKWNSFASEPTASSVTLNSWMKKAHGLGWKGQIRQSAAALFGSNINMVAAMATAAGATLAGSSPLPMMAGQAALADIGSPILAEFLTSTRDAPLRPLCADYPTMPAAAEGHGLFGPLRDCIDRIVAMAETPKTWKATRCIDAMAVLSLVHVDVFDAVCRKLNALGVAVPTTKIRQSAIRIGDRVEREFVKNDAWHLDARGFIEHDNSDNVLVFLGSIAAEIRWNGWLERAEIRGGLNVTVKSVEWPDWTYVDDVTVAVLRTRACRTKTRFRPGKEFFWESLLSIAHANAHDPVLHTISNLQAAWDGVPRLSIWLTAACGVPCDHYHRAVGRNIIGGMVRRARNPGCKHDTMPVFFGPQGTGKTTLAAILAMQTDLFTDAVMLGDASKELVLSLAGKLVAEISEMGMRGSTNASHVKKMVSAQFDEGRTAYARAVTKRNRRNIFIGTTNDPEPLTDPTGNRRFLPVRVEQEIDLTWMRANIEQLVGEAATLESAGVSFDLPRDVWAAAAEHQEAARSASDIEVLLADWFAPTEMTGPLTYITANDLIHLAGIAGWRSAGTARSTIMKRLGFRTESPIMNGKRTVMWVRGETRKIADVPRLGTRYMVGQDNTGRPVVNIRSAAR